MNVILPPNEKIVEISVVDKVIESNNFDQEKKKSKCLDRTNSYAIWLIGSISACGSGSRIFTPDWSPPLPHTRCQVLFPLFSAGCSLQKNSIK